MDTQNDWGLIHQIDENATERIKNVVCEIIEKNQIQSDIKNRSPKGNVEQFYLLPHEILYRKQKLFELINYLGNLTRNILLEKSILDASENLTYKSSWSVVGKKDSYHTVHKHSFENSDKEGIVTILYLNVPEKKDEKSGNFFSFFRNNTVHEIDPKVGNFIIIPSWIYHGTYPQSDGIRQTLNMDFGIE